MRLFSWLRERMGPRSFRLADRPDRNRRFRPRLESLEDRRVLSPAALGPPLPGHSGAARHLQSAQSGTIDVNNDGVVDRVFGSALTYNARGQVLQAEYFGDIDNDGTVDFIDTYTNPYNSLGRRVAET